MYGLTAPVGLKSSTQLVRLLRPVPRVTPRRDSAVVRSLLAARPIRPKRGGQVRAW
jgi:hypothetical protein